jgi:hypothetical protein
MSFDKVTLSDKTIFNFAGYLQTLKRTLCYTFREQIFSLFINLNSYTTLITLKNNIVRCEGYLRYNKKNAIKKFAVIQ